jgi:hypothetical protein
MFRVLNAHRLVLLALRAQIDTRLGEKRGELEKMLARMDNGSNGVGNVVKGRGKGLKGRKVAPKFRSKKDPESLGPAEGQPRFGCGMR